MEWQNHKIMTLFKKFNTDNKNEVMEEILALANGNLNSYIRFPGRSSFTIFEAMLRCDDLHEGLIDECMKRGAIPPKHVLWESFNDRKFKLFKGFIRGGVDPNTNDALNMHFLEDTVNDNDITFFLLMYGSDPQIPIDIIINHDMYGWMSGRERLSFEHLGKCLQIQKIINVAKSFVMATCVDNIDFKETMMYSLWPRLKKNLFSDFY